MVERNGRASQNGWGEGASRAAGDGVPLRAKIRCQVTLHNDRGGVWHGVQVREEFGQEMEPVLANGPCRLVAVLVIFETVFDGEASHADVDARFCGIALRVGAQDGGMFGDCGIEEDDVDAVVMVVGHWGERWVVYATQGDTRYNEKGRNARSSRSKRSARGEN